MIRTHEMDAPQLQGLHLGEAGAAIAAGSNIMLLSGTTNAICQLQVRFGFVRQTRPAIPGSCLGPSQEVDRCFAACVALLTTISGA